MRRLIGPILAVALLAAATGTASAAPNRTATLWACTTLGGVQVHVDWTGYHPDNAVAVAWQAPTSSVVTASPETRQTDWKFGNAIWDTAYATWSGVGVTFASDTSVAVDLYAHGRLLAETNAVLYGSMNPC